MLIFLFLGALFLAGALIYKYSWEGVGVVLMFVSGMFFLVAIATMPASRYGIYAQIEKFESTRTTYETARQKINRSAITEIAAIQIDIAKQNRWLVGAQYWNDTIFDKWIPDEVMSLKPIE